MLLDSLEVGFIVSVKLFAVFFSNGGVQATVDVLIADFTSEFYGTFEVGYPLVRGLVKKKRI